MLSLVVNTVPLDLSMNARVTLNLSNPIFDQDSIERTFSFPFNLPLTARNKSVFAHAERLDSDENNEYYDAQLYIHSQLFETGKLRIEGYSNDFLKVSFQNPARNLLDELERFQINEILDTVRFSNAFRPRVELRVLFPQVRWAMQLNNNQYVKGIDNDNSAQDIAEHFRAVINADYPSAAQIRQQDGEVHLLIFDIENERFDIYIETGFEITQDNAPAVNQQKDFLTHVAEVAATPVATHAFPTIVNTAMYGSTNDAYLGVINYLHGDYQIENTPQTTPQWETSHIPMVRIPYILQAIATRSENISVIIGDFLETTDGNSLLIYNNFLLDDVAEYTDAAGEIVYLNQYLSQIDLNRHVPDMTARDFLRLFADAFNLFYRQDENNRLIAYRRRDLLAVNAIDWTTRAEYNYNAKNNYKNGVQLDFAEPDNDNYTNLASLQPYQTGLGEEEIRVPFRPIHRLRQIVDIEENIDPFQWIIPVLREQGSSEQLGNNNSDLRFLFYRGLQPASDGQLYPMGDYADTNIEDTPTGSLTLDWHGQQGLYAQLWQEYAQLLTADEVTIPCRLTINDLLELRRWQNARRYIQHEKGNLDGIIKKVQVTVTTTRIEVAKVTFAKKTN